MIQELPELKVTVDRVVFAPHLDAPPERPYPFVYFITILNASDKTVTLKGRKWVVTDSQNQSVVVEGEGVVDGDFVRVGGFCGEVEGGAFRVELPCEASGGGGEAEEDGGLSGGAWDHGGVAGVAGCGRATLKKRSFLR